MTSRGRQHSLTTSSASRSRDRLRVAAPSRPQFLGCNTAVEVFYLIVEQLDFFSRCVLVFQPVAETTERFLRSAIHC